MCGLQFVCVCALPHSLISTSNWIAVCKQIMNNYSHACFGTQKAYNTAKSNTQQSTQRTYHIHTAQTHTSAMRTVVLEEEKSVARVRIFVQRVIRCNELTNVHGVFHIHIIS